MSTEDVKAELTQLRAAIEENARAIREIARRVAARRQFLDRGALSVNFIIRPWDVPPERRGPFRWRRLGQYIAFAGGDRVHVFLPAILAALEEHRESKHLEGPVPEIQLVEQIVYATGHEVLHRAFKGSGLSYDQEHQAIAAIFKWIWTRRVPVLQRKAEMNPET